MKNVQDTIFKINLAQIVNQPLIVIRYSASNSDYSVKKYFYVHPKKYNSIFHEYPRFLTGGTYYGPGGPRWSQK